MCDSVSDGAAAADDRLEARAVSFGEQPVEALALDLLDRVAEHALDRRALVRDDAVCVEHGDQVARMCDERAEARLALLPVEVFGERRGLERERHLRGEIPSESTMSDGTSSRRLDEERALVLVAHREPHDERVERFAEAERGERLLGRRDDGDSARAARAGARSSWRPARETSQRACAVGGGDLCAVARPEDEPDLRRAARRSGGRGATSSLTLARPTASTRARARAAAARAHAPSHVPPAGRARPCAARRAGRGSRRRRSRRAGRRSRSPRRSGCPVRSGRRARAARAASR